MKTIFFGSSDYCLPILEALNNNFQLAAIITKSDSSPKLFASSRNIKVFTPRDKTELLSLNKDLIALKPDLAIVADYGLIIPKEIFEIPRYKTLNIHFSKLPALRGPSPVQYTILMGGKTAWITIIIMDEEMDTGDIIWQKPFDFPSTSLGINAQGKEGKSETTESLYKKLFSIAATELPDIVNKYIKGEIKPQKQDHKQATYTKHLTREDGFIPPPILESAMKGLSLDKRKLCNWQLAIKIPQLSIINYQLSIERAIRALSPWPGLWTKVSITKGVKDTSDGGPPAGGTPPRWRDQIKKRLKILKAHLEIDPIQDRKAKPNLVRKARLILDLVQLEGKKPVSWKQFREGYPHRQFP